MEMWDWYYSSLSRLDCEKILKDQKNGAFLIRQSESTSDHVLSICWDGHAHHYKIIRSPNGVHLNTAVGVEHVYFDTFDKLVAYYTVPDRGLMYTLTEPVRNEIMCMENSEDDDTDDSDYDEDDPVTPFFLQRLDILTGIRRDTSFKKYLLDYLSKGVKKDYQRVKNGSNNPSMFKEMLVHSADDLIESFQKFYARLKIIHELFDVGSNTEDDMNEIFKDTSSPHKDFDYLIKLLSECPGNISKLQKKMCKVLQEYSGQNSSDMVQRKKDPSKSTKETEYSVLTYDGKAGPTVENSECNTSTQKVFEVTSGPLKTKSYISLDVKCGHMIFLKNQNDKPENGTSYTSDQVIQLVKSKSSKVKLGIFLENTNVKNYHFENYRSRELFCSSVQQIKIAHMNDRQSSKQLSVFIGTWNMGDATADDIDEWFLCSGFGKTKLGDFSHIPEDIFAIGTQESAYHEKDWTNRLKSTLSKIFKEKFRLVTCYSMWDIRIVIFVKAELYNLVNCLKQSSVKTGIANTLGNKGAVGVSFNIASTSFCFINCHLTSGNEKILRRNQNFHSILKGLNVGQGDTFDLTLSFHHLFWFGDLNYRINLEVTDIIKKIMEKDWHKLMASDQLCAERINGNAFIDFIEVDLQFPPTYRYTRGTRSTYTWTKAKLTGTRTNVPSWCDRVLWRSYPHLTSCNTTYGCTEKVCSSDHSPVFATFDVGVVSQTLAVDNQEHKTSCKVTGSCVKITMSSAEAKILTSSTTKFILEFHSTCFEQSVTSKKNSMDNIGQKQDSLFRGSIPGDRSYSYPWWTKNDLCVLQPVLSDPYYLENQHLLIAVKAEEGQESYGECIISLKPLLVGQPITLQQKLTHFGVSTGTLKLQCQMNVPEDYNYTPSMPTSKVYDLIKIEEENTNENRVLPDPVNKKEQKRIPIPKDNSRMIDRSSIQQVDPVNKVVESCHLVLDDRRKSLGLGFDNPMVKLRKSKENPDSLVKSFNGINHRASAPDFLDHSDTFGAPPTLPPKKKNTPKCPSTGDETLNSPINPRLEESDSEKALLETRFTQSLPRHLPSMKDIFYVPPASDALPLALPPALPPHEPHISKRLSNAPRYMPPEPPDLHTEELSPPVAQQRTKKKKRQISKFYDWLLEHGFETYYDILLKNGFDDLEYFCCVTEQDLLKIGVECDDDRKNIVAAAQALEKDRKNNFC